VGRGGVLSIGVDPAAAALNGLSSYDGYSALYPLWYKAKFREVIERVIEDTPNYEYFESWGSRVYAFADAKNYSDLNFCAAQSMGVEFIVSGFALKNDFLESLDLSEDSSLFLYKLGGCPPHG
jgi:hypothetical protein